LTLEQGGELTKKKRGAGEFAQVAGQVNCKKGLVIGGRERIGLQEGQSINAKGVGKGRKGSRKAS